MKAEVVSVDETAKSITVKDSTGANQTLTASGKAVAELAKVKAGEMVAAMMKVSRTGFDTDVDSDDCFEIRLRDRQIRGII